MRWTRRWVGRMKRLPPPIRSDGAVCRTIAVKLPEEGIPANGESGQGAGRILSGRSDNNILFDDLRNVLIRLGFSERIKGDHHIFSKSSVREILNLQPRSDGKAKPYQVKQVCDVLNDYGLTQFP